MGRHILGTDETVSLVYRSLFAFFYKTKSKYFAYTSFHI